MREISWNTLWKFWQFYNLKSTGTYVNETSIELVPSTFIFAMSTKAEKIYKQVSAKKL